MIKKSLVLAASLALAACQPQQQRPQNNGATVADAEQFLQQVESTLIKDGEYAARIAWVQANFITEDTIWLGAKSTEKMGSLQVKFANQAKQFDDLGLRAGMRRRLNIIKGGLTLAAPDDVEKMHVWHKLWPHWKPCTVQENTVKVTHANL